MRSNTFEQPETLRVVLFFIVLIGDDIYDIIVCHDLVLLFVRQRD